MLRFVPCLALLLAACAATPAPAPLPALPNLAQQRDDVVTAGAIAAGDIEPMRAAGIRSVIDLRVDDETPAFDEREAVTSAGLEYTNVPVHGADGLTRETVAAFDAALRASPRPVLVHCTSSNRVGAMAALRAAWIGGAPAEEALATGRAWGLKGLEPDVRRLLETPPP
ncbi:MAG TPA: protein tyrosine phosphatase family protein [Xanthomonadales bacterium]|nr:protein tyrosine phosphatase family protein [Xanthomonadales bacterium]